MGEEPVNATLPLPSWLKDEIESSADAKITVSLKWLMMVLDKAGLDMPSDVIEALDVAYEDKQTS